MIMKASRYLIAAVVFALFVSCEEGLEEAIQIPNTSEVDDKEVVFYASAETPLESKAAVQEDSHSIWWEPGDQIKVFSGTAEGVFTTNLKQSSSKALFRGSFADGEKGDYCIAVYPAKAAQSMEGNKICVSIPTNQVATEGSFDPNAYVALARTEDSNLLFYSVCGGLKFSIDRDDIIKVELETSNTVTGTYEAYITASASGAITSYGLGSEVSGNKYVTMKYANERTFKSNTPYYLVLKPHTMGSYTIRLFTSSGAVGTFKSSKQVIVKAGTFGVIEQLDRFCSWADNRIIEPDAVDLGLPSGLKWGSFNLGASSPASYGSYFAWGETTNNKGPLDFSWRSYEVDGYNNSDGKTVLSSDDDAATVNLGGKWRMPEAAEFTELIDNCQWTWCKESGIYGYTATGPNGNSIFFPAGGFSYNGHLISLQENGNYWSATLSSETTSAGQWLDFKKTSVAVGWNARAMGAQIRPVTMAGDYIMPSSVTLNESSLELTKGESYKLEASVMPVYSAYKSFLWTSSNTSVVTVNDNGLVTAIGSGAATVTATTQYGGVSAKCAVRVYNMPESIELSADAVDLAVGESIKITATIHPEDVKDKTPLWSSSDKSVASVSSDGTVTGVSEGEATITAQSSNGISASASVIVKNLSVESVSLSKSELTLMVGSFSKLAETITPSNAADKRLTWLSSESSVASVSSDGLICAKAIGTAIISVITHDRNKVAKCTLTVVESDTQPKAIDLGLSVKWGSKNVGASSPEDYGQYFSWGETEPKTSFFWDNYIWGTGTYSNFTKYYDGDYTSLASADQVPSIRYTSKWRMPTCIQIKELIDNCTWKETTLNGVDGYEVKSNKNSNSIFIPKSGSFRNSASLSFAGYEACLWGSTYCCSYYSAPRYSYLGIDVENPAYAHIIDCDNVRVTYLDRWWGIPIRPVY